MKLSLKKFYYKKKVLVTGATGFKGAWLSQWLLKLGSKVYGIGYNPNLNKNLFYKLNLHKKIKIKLFDIRDYKILKKYINKIKPSIIFHLAAQPLIYESYKKPLLTFDVNFRGSLNIVDIAKDVNSVRSIIVVTSDKCYESNNSKKGFKEEDLLGGIDPYSASKSTTEIMVRAYRESFFKAKKKIGLSTGRAGNVIGGGDWSSNRLIPDSVRSLLKNKVINIRNPNFNRPWQHVLEPLKGYLILAKKQYQNPKKFSGAWNFGTNPNSLTNVKNIVKFIIKFWGSGKIKLRKTKFYEQKNLQLNISKAKNYLNWFPAYKIRESVKITTDWYYRVLKLKHLPEKVSMDQIEKYEKDSKIY
jgi:CDP-glucose 4,6-dehydratase